MTIAISEDAGLTWPAPSGLIAAAHVLSTRGPVTLYEADDRLGGHADTHVVPTADGELRIDTVLQHLGLDPEARFAEASGGRCSLIGGR